MGLREQILAARDIKTETLFMPEWDVSVTLRSLNGLEREALNTLVYEARQKGRSIPIFAAVAAFSIVDEEGRRVFSDDDIPALAQRTSASLERFYDWQVKHSGIGDKSVEDALKNSGAGQNGAMPSASPSVSAA
jgi:hypothetical protein